MWFVVVSLVCFDFITTLYHDKVSWFWDNRYVNIVANSGIHTRADKEASDVLQS